MRCRRAWRVAPCRSRRHWCPAASRPRPPPPAGPGRRPRFAEGRPASPAPVPVRPGSRRGHRRQARQARSAGRRATARACGFRRTWPRSAPARTPRPAHRNPPHSARATAPSRWTASSRSPATAHGQTTRTPIRPAGHTTSPAPRRAGRTAVRACAATGRAFRSSKSPVRSPRSTPPTRARSRRRQRDQGCPQAIARRPPRPWRARAARAPADPAHRHRRSAARSRCPDAPW